MNYLDRIGVLRNVWVQLLLCIVGDIIGMLSYLVMGIGEATDIVWAPIQTAFIYLLIGEENAANFFYVLSFTEEILPFTDIIPSCTLAWFYKWWWIK